MTLYNKGPFVEEAVRSVLAQTFTDFELLVVDDASTDDGRSRIAAIGDPRIRIVSMDRNRGRPAAANRGFQESRGRYVAILDADDLMTPDRLGMQVAFMDRHPEVGVCGGWCECFGSSSKRFEFPTDDESIRAGSLFYVPLLYPAAMFRRSVWEASGVRCREDWTHPGMDYLFLAGMLGHTRFSNIPHVLLRYRLGEQNMRAGRDKVTDRIIRIEAALELFGMPRAQGEAEALAMLEGHFAHPPTARGVLRMRSAVRRLTRVNRRLGKFPKEGFERHIDRLWVRLYFLLFDRSLAASWTYMLVSRKSWSPNHLNVLVRATLKRLIGRRPR